MASMKQQLESLRGVTLFSACTNKELEKVAKATDKITMTAGTMVMDGAKWDARPSWSSQAT